MIFDDSFDTIFEKAFIEAVNADFEKITKNEKKLGLCDKDKKFLRKLLTTDPDKYLPQELSKTLNLSPENRLVLSITFLKKSEKEKENIFDCEFVFLGIFVHLSRIDLPCVQEDLIVVKYQIVPNDSFEKNEREIHKKNTAVLCRTVVFTIP
jgi:hypothetical protein